MDINLLDSINVEINGKPVEPEVGTLGPLYATQVASGERYISYAAMIVSWGPARKLRRPAAAGS